MSKSIEEITEIHRRMGSLLSDPQPGLFTWCQAFRDVFKELVDTVVPPDEKKPEPQPNELTPEERDMLDAGDPRLVRQDRRQQLRHGIAARRKRRE